MASDEENRAGGLAEGVQRTSIAVLFVVASLFSHLLSVVLDETTPPRHPSADYQPHDDPTSEHIFVFLGWWVLLI